MEAKGSKELSMYPQKAAILVPHPSTEEDQSPENQAEGEEEGTLASQGKETPEAKKWT